MANKECQWCQARAAPESYRLNGWLWIWQTEMYRVTNSSGDLLS
jgi:hypothetical protein